MKRTLTLLLAVLILLLPGCGAAHHYQFARPTEQVVRITIVDESNGRTATEYTTDFLEKLRALPCRDYHNDPSTDVGPRYVVIEYKDGTREYIGASANYVEKNGKQDYGWEYFDNEAFFALLDEQTQAGGSR